MPEDSLASLILAMLGFVGGHFLLSHPPVRGRLAGRLGEPGFIVLYSVIALLTPVWAVRAYASASCPKRWNPGVAGHRVPRLVMPLAFILASLAANGDAAGLILFGVPAVG